MKQAYGRDLLHEWHAGPIHSSPRGGLSSPRATSAAPFMGSAGGSPRSRPDQLKDFYYTTAMAGQLGGGGPASFWDTFVAKQNSRAVDTLGSYGASRSGSPRTAALLATPRVGGRVSPPRQVGKNLGESLGKPIPKLVPQSSFNPHSPRYKNHPTLMEAIRPGALAGPVEEVAARQKRMLEMKRRQMTKLEKRIIQETEYALESRFSDMWHAFSNIDVDASGKVSKEEIIDALHQWSGGQIGYEELAREAETIIKQCDADGDGYIDYHEFADGLAKHKKIEPPKYSSKAIGDDPLRDPLSRLHPGVDAQELVDCHAAVRERLLAKHDTIHKAFKFMDTDGSGFINRSEFQEALKKLNIQVRAPVLDSLLDIIDQEDNDDGGTDHDIGFKEFARVLQAQDIFKMQALAPRPKSHVLSAREQARVDALKYLRPGCTQEELRKFQEQAKSKISAKYGKHAFTSAFKWIDADRTGSITRDEFKQAIDSLNLGFVKPAVLETLCDFIDVSGDGTFGYREFARVLSAEDVMQMAPGKDLDES